MTNTGALILLIITLLGLGIAIGMYIASQIENNINKRK